MGDVSTMTIPPVHNEGWLPASLATKKQGLLLLYIRYQLRANKFSHDYEAIIIRIDTFNEQAALCRRTLMA